MQGLPTPGNLAQAKELVRRWGFVIIGIPEHECGETCGVRCLVPLHIGSINASQWTGNDALWGPHAQGHLFAEYDYRTKKVDRFWGSFPMPPGKGVYTEDYTDALLAEASAEGNG